MKKLLFLSAISYLAVSCAVHYNARDIAGYTDYTRHLREGFFVSPKSIDDLPEGYVALGDMSFIAYEEYDSKTGLKRQYEQDVLDKMVAEAKKRGANGIVNFKAIYSPIHFVSQRYSTEFHQSYIAATGIAIYTPQIPEFISNPILPNTSSTEEAAPALRYATDEQIVNETIKYALEHNVKPIKFWNGDEIVLDIDTKEYITTYKYCRKYNNKIYSLIRKGYKIAKKQMKNINKKNKDNITTQQ